MNKLLLLIIFLLVSCQAREYQLLNHQVVGVDGERLTMLTANKSLNLDPAWDGSGRVGYMSYRSGNADWVVEGAIVSGRPGMNAAGAWSRDGND